MIVATDKFVRNSTKKCYSSDEDLICFGQAFMDLINYLQKNKKIFYVRKNTLKKSKRNT